MDNKIIAQQLKNLILKDVEIAMAIRSRKKGKIKIFLRNNTCQKITYQAVEINTRTLNLDDWDGIELPDKVYRRFCLLLCDMVGELEFSLEYGHLICEWEFTQLSDPTEWEEHFILSFEKETHFSHKPTSNAVRTS